MRLRPFALALLLAALPACKHRQTAEQGLALPEFTIPTKITSLDEFAALRNHFALLHDAHPDRSRLRSALIEFLAAYLRTELDRGREEEATNALHFLAGLFTPSELRSQGHGPIPAIAHAAHSLYVAAARRGNEPPAMFALALGQHFGDAASRKRALRDWRDLEDWIVRNGMFSSEPVLRHEELEEALEETASVFPSPFVVQRLADLYVARFEAATAAVARGAEVGLAARQRAEITGYLLLRLYLRADDFEGAIAALSRIELDLPTRKMIEFVERAQHSDRSAGPLLTLAAQFIPEGPTDEFSRIPPSFFTQGWGIVDNLARRAVRGFPDDPFAHILFARSLRQEGLIDAAIFHFEQALRRKEDIFDAWQELAVLHQLSLDRLSEESPDAALTRLATIERLHTRAAKLWRDRPIRPSLPEAQVTAAQSLFNSGRIAESRALLDRSITTEPSADALHLLGTIDTKSGSLDAAERSYRALLGLPFENQLERLRWEQTASANLARIAKRRGDLPASTELSRAALRQLNTLIGFPSLREAQRSRLLLERGRLFVELGEVKLGLDDFKQARLSAPDRPDVYTDPLIVVISHGYYEEARDIFTQAMSRDDLRDTLKLYFSLWMNDLSLRQGRDGEPAAVDFIRAYKVEPWPRKLALHAQGKLGYDELLAAARDRGERAEAHFYEGLRRWRAGDASAGAELLRKVIDSDMMGFFEYEMARYYLDAGELTPKK